MHFKLFISNILVAKLIFRGELPFVTNLYWCIVRYSHVTSFTRLMQDKKTNIAEASKNINKEASAERNASN